jgi:hypothetical protein
VADDGCDSVNEQLDMLNSTFASVSININLDYACRIITI